MSAVHLVNILIDNGRHVFDELPFFRKLSKLVALVLLLIAIIHLFRLDGRLEEVVLYLRLLFDRTFHGIVSRVNIFRLNLGLVLGELE